MFSSACCFVRQPSPMLSRRQAVAYGLGGFAAAIITTLFELYNVVLFTQVIKLDASYFYTGHVLYGLWNAVNDPAFGWIIDRTANHSSRRLPVLKYGGPLWALLFMGTWYPWSTDGSSALAAAHFLFSMFCFDGFLTFVLIVKCALLADLSIDSQERNQLNLYSAWFGLAGSSLAAATFYVFDEDDLGPFRFAAWGCSALSGTAWYASGHLLVLPATQPPFGGKLVASTMSGAPQAKGWFAELREWSQFARQLLRHRNFLLYVTMNWFMNFNVTLSASFFVILDRRLMRHVMPPTLRAVVTAASLYVPKLGVQVMTPFANRHGVYELLRCTTALLVLIDALSLSVGMGSYLVWGCLVVLQRILFASWGFYDLVMADVIDEDRVIHQRKESVATSVHGVQALIVKPSQSLAPMFGIWLLSRYGLQEDGERAGPDDTSGNEELQKAVFHLTFAVPLVITFCQLVVWRHFDLRRKKLARVKHELASLQETAQSEKYAANL